MNELQLHSLSPSERSQVLDGERQVIDCISLSSSRFYTAATMLLYRSRIWISAQEHCNLIKLALGPVCQPVLLGWQPPPWLVILNYTFQACTTPSAWAQCACSHACALTWLQIQCIQRETLQLSHTVACEENSTHIRAHTRTHACLRAQADWGPCFGSWWCGCA